MQTAVRLFALSLLVAAPAACVYENEPPRRLAPDPEPSPDPGSGSSSSGGTTPPPSPSPMLVEVDTDQTMAADPGQGVGVFIEYHAGGHWNVWWTCDTAKTNQGCEFVVSATAASGNITKPDASGMPGGFLTTPTPSRVDARTTTRNEVHGIKFDTNPGAVVTIEASVGGLKDGAFLFFVQDGKVNGGFTGKLTNPLQLQGKTP